MVGAGSLTLLGALAPANSRFAGHRSRHRHQSVSVGMLAWVTGLSHAALGHIQPQNTLHVLLSPSAYQENLAVGINLEIMLIHRIIESFRVEKTPKIIESTH